MSNGQGAWLARCLTRAPGHQMGIPLYPVRNKGVGALGLPVPISSKSALLFSWRTIVAECITPLV